MPQGLDAIRTAQQKATTENLEKSFTQSSNPLQGLQAYDLEAPARNFVPILTPLRNMIPRVVDGYGSQASWKVIDGINVHNQRAGVGEGRRGGLIEHSMSDYFASYRGFGLENKVTFEADYAAKGFDNIKARAVTQTLQATMIEEERLILGGNTAVAMGQTPTPTLSASNDGGSLPETTFSVICVALGLQAYLDVAGANNGNINQKFNAYSKVPSEIVRNNTDGTVERFGGGSARKSQPATISTPAGDHAQITATVNYVNGAVGYAWYLGSPGQERLVAISTLNSVILNNAPSGIEQLASELTDKDNSTSTLDFDGLLTQAFKPESQAYVKVMPTGTAGIGSTLTSDGAGGITEFDEALEHLYTNYRLTPDVIYVSTQELSGVTKLIIKNGGAPLLHLNVDATNPSSIQAGATVGSYQSKITGKRIPITVHPNLAAGTIFMFTKSLPYPVSNVDNIVQMKMRRDYYQTEWPLRTRAYEYGVYADGVLQHYAPFSMAIITNIAPSR